MLLFTFTALLPVCFPDFFCFVFKEFISLVLWYLPPCMLSLGDLISCCGSEWTDIHVIIATTLSLLIPTFTRDVPVLYLTQHIWITCTALSIKLIFFLLISVKTIITDPVDKYSIFLDASPSPARLILLVPGSFGSSPLKCLYFTFSISKAPCPSFSNYFKNLKRNECYWTYTMRPARTMISKLDKGITKKKNKGHSYWWMMQNFSTKY